MIAAPRRLRLRPGGFGERGASAVEFALVVVPMLALIWGAISYGIMFTYRQALSQAAGEGARAAVAAPAASTSTSATAAITSALSFYGQTCGGTLTCTISGPTVCQTTHTCVTVTVSYPYAANPIVPNVPGFGILLPSTLSFTQTVQVS